MDTLQNDQNQGRLIVQVSAASGAVPIPNASVIVRGRDTETQEFYTLGALRTDQSGITEAISIATPPLSESLSPGGKQPFSEISTEVTADGYFSAVNFNIPIYPGITSIQPIALIPLPDSLYGSQPNADIVIRNDEQSPNL